MSETAVLPEAKPTYKYRIDAQDVTRLDEFSVPPDQIIVDQDMNGREQPHSEKSVDEMVESIIAHGQLQAVACRKVQGSKLKLVFGNRRWRAISKINSNPELLARAKVPEGDKLKVRVKVRDLNDEEAFAQNLTENMERADLCGLDHAHNQRVLRERFHWTEERIAKLYQQSASYVSLLKRAHQIPSEVQQLIREKKLTLSDGIDLTILPEQDQVEVVRNAQDSNGHVDSSVVRSAVRERKIQEGKKKSRTIREVRKFFANLKEENDIGGINALADATLKFLDGRILEKTYQEKLWEIIR